MILANLQYLIKKLEINILTGGVLLGLSKRPGIQKLLI